MQSIGPALPTDDTVEQLPSKEAFVLQGHDGPVLAVRFNQLGTYCLSAGRDRTIRLWNPHKGTAIKTYTGHGYDVRDVCISSDNSKFASCGGDRQIFLWDVASGRTIRKLAGHDGVVNGICYAPNDEVLASAGYDQAVKLWDCRSRNWEPVQIMRAFADSVTSVTITSGAEIIAGSVDGTVRRFDVRMGLELADALEAPVTCVAVSHDGNCLLAACTDGAMRLLDKQTGTLLAMYEGHKHESYSLDCALTPSDAFVICGSEDGRVCFWELVDAELVHEFPAHAGAVCSLAMHPGGECLVTSSNDGTIKVWT